MVAKLHVKFYATVVLGCVDDRITNIKQKCIKWTIPWIYGSSKCLLPHENPGSKWENMVAFATKIPRISSPVNGLFKYDAPPPHVHASCHSTCFSPDITVLLAAVSISIRITRFLRWQIDGSICQVVVEARTCISPSVLLRSHSLSVALDDRMCSSVLEASSSSRPTKFLPFVAYIFTPAPGEECEGNAFWSVCVFVCPNA